MMLASLYQNIVHITKMLLNIEVQNSGGIDFSKFNNFCSILNHQPKINFPSSVTQKLALLL